jgi:hypothetical protein
MLYRAFEACRLQAAPEAALDAQPLSDRTSHTRAGYFFRSMQSLATSIASGLFAPT